MHIYSFRLWMILITVFAGVSVAKANAADDCWAEHKWTVTKGQPAGKPKAMRECSKGVVTQNKDGMTVCRISSRKGNRDVVEYYIDSACTQPVIAALNPNAGKIPEMKVHTGVDIKKSGERQQQDSKVAPSNRKTAGSKSGSTDPNGAGTPPDSSTEAN